MAKQCVYARVVLGVGIAFLLLLNSLLRKWPPSFILNPDAFVRGGVNLFRSQVQHASEGTDLSQE